MYVAFRSALPSMRCRLAIFSIALLAPVLGLCFLIVLDQRRAAVERAEERVSTLHRLAIREEQLAFEEARQLLSGLSVSGAAPLSEACGEILGRLSGEGLRYDNLSVVAPNGDLLCSAKPVVGPVNFGASRWFQETVQRGGFFAGQYVISRLDGRPGLIAAVPAPEAGSSRPGAIAVTLPILWPERLMVESRLPAGSSLTLFTSDGTIFARVPDPARWVGRTIPDWDLLGKTLGEGAGTYQLNDLDGQARLASVRPLEAQSSPPLFLAIALPTDAAFESVNRVTRNLAALVALSVIAILGLGIVMEVFVLRPVHALTRAATLRAAGDLTARSGLRHGAGEMGRLAEAFDVMAESRERAELEVRALNESLERRVQERTEELARANADLVELTDQLEARVASRTRELEAKNREAALMSAQLWQTAKLATMGELAAGVAHELNNPLAIAELRIESILSQLADSPARPSLEIVDQELERMAGLVARLLEGSRAAAPQRSSVDIREEVEKTVDLMEYQLRSHNITLDRAYEPGLPLVQGDRQQLRQVFLNLFSNAIDAMPDGGTLTVRVKSRPSPNGEEPRAPSDGSADGERALVLEIADTGVGIAPDNLARVMDSFFTTKDEGKGTGLGLAICQRVVHEHQGGITLTSEVGKGTLVRVTLPVRGSAEAV